MPTDPLCACGHRKSEHNTRFRLGKMPKRLVCDARFPTENRKLGHRDGWCSCKWFRLALTESKPVAAAM